MRGQEFSVCGRHCGRQERVEDEVRGHGGLCHEWLAWPDKESKH